MSGMKKTDLQLIEDFRGGNQQAFEELLGRYSNKAFGLASRLTRNLEDAEEVLQDVFVTVYRKIDGFEGKSSFSSWLYRVTVNSALMKLRKKKQDQSTPIEDLLTREQNSAPSPLAMESAALDTLAMRKELLHALSDAVSRLPDDYRPVFILRDVDGLSSRQVGKMLNLSIPAVKSRLHRSRLILRRRLLALYREYSLQVLENSVSGA